MTRELYPVVSDHSFIRILGDERGDIWSLRSKLGLVSSDLQYDYSGRVRVIEVVLSGFYSSVGLWGHHDVSEDQIRKATDVLEGLEIKISKDES